MSNNFLVISLLFAASILFVGCVTQQSSNPTAVPSAGNTKVFTITATDFSFDPSLLSVAAGQPVSVVFRNRGTVVHTFTIPDLGINTGPVQPGSDKIVAFNAPTQVGAHQFLCAITGHADRGMTGTITIG